MYGVTASRIRKVWNDGILVRAIQPEQMARGFYVPMNAQDNLRRSHKLAWRGEVLKWGPDFKVEGYKPKKGDVLVFEPVAKSCPSWSEEGEDFIIAKDDDVLARQITNGV